jgi:hypothetical protein
VSDLVISWFFDDGAFRNLAKLFGLSVISVQMMRVPMSFHLGETQRHIVSRPSSFSFFSLEMKPKRISSSSVGHSCAVVGIVKSWLRDSLKKMVSPAG